MVWRMYGLLALTVGSVCGSVPSEGQKRVSKPVENATSRLPVLKPDEVKDPYYRALLTELQVFRPRRLLLEADSTETYRKFSFDNREGRAIKEDIPVSGQLFTRGWEIKTEKKREETLTNLQRFGHWPIRRGDMLLVTAYVRAEEVAEEKEAGVGRFVASIVRSGEPKANVTLYKAAFVIPEDWTRVHFIMTAPRDFAPKDELTLMFAFGGETQEIQIGGIALVQFGSDVKAASLTRKLKSQSRER